MATALRSMVTTRVRPLEDNRDLLQLLGWDVALMVYLDTPASSLNDPRNRRS